jgi:hypothetical protein
MPHYYTSTVEGLTGDQTALFFAFAVIVLYSLEVGMITCLRVVLTLEFGRLVPLLPISM